MQVGTSSVSHESNMMEPASCVGHYILTNSAVWLPVTQRASRNESPSTKPPQMLPHHDTHVGWRRLRLSAVWRDLIDLLLFKFLEISLTLWPFQKCKKQKKTNSLDVLKYRYNNLHFLVYMWELVSVAVHMVALVTREHPVFVQFFNCSIIKVTYIFIFPLQNILK